MPMADDEDGNAQKADIDPATIKIDWHASRTEWIDRIEAQLAPQLADEPIQKFKSLGSLHESDQIVRDVRT